MSPWALTVDGLLKSIDKLIFLFHLLYILNSPDCGKFQTISASTCAVFVGDIQSHQSRESQPLSCPMKTQMCSSIEPPPPWSQVRRGVTSPCACGQWHRSVWAHRPPRTPPQGGALSADGTQSLGAARCTVPTRCQRVPSRPPPPRPRPPRPSPPSLSTARAVTTVATAATVTAVSALVPVPVPLPPVFSCTGPGFTRAPPPPLILSLLLSHSPLSPASATLFCLPRSPISTPPLTTLSLPHPRRGRFPPATSCRGTRTPTRTARTPPPRWWPAAGHPRTTPPPTRGRRRTTGRRTAGSPPMARPTAGRPTTARRRRRT